MPDIDLETYWRRLLGPRVPPPSGVQPPTMDAGQGYVWIDCISSKRGEPIVFSGVPRTTVPFQIALSSLRFFVQMSATTSTVDVSGILIWDHIHKPFKVFYFPEGGSYALQPGDSLNLVLTMTFPLDPVLLPEDR